MLQRRNALCFHGINSRVTRPTSPLDTWPNGTPGVPITEAQAGTFGYMLGPLNRTVGLGTARQTQLSVRYSF